MPRQAAPSDDQDLLALEDALKPLEPFLRGVTYERLKGGKAAERPCQVMLCLGADAVPFSVTQRDDGVVIDCPVATVPQTSEALTTILRMNANRFWKYRVDAIEGPHEAPEVLLVLERFLWGRGLDDLAETIMLGLIQKEQDQALITKCREQHG